MTSGYSESNRYDTVPYFDRPYRGTHPRNLETIARLLRIQSPPIPTCRVLELGCAAGANLIPQACDLPGAKFVGVDFSKVQIERGQSTVRALGLSNIELHHANVMEIDDRSGKFDYIIAHGIYSWVPEQVRRKILEICRANLSDNGVAMVSYNTYPGWHIKAIARELMLYHADGIDDPRAQIREARAVLDFLVELQANDDPIAMLLQRERELLQRHGDEYLFHEFLEPQNVPCYFHQFVEAAQEAGLQYLTDVDLSRTLLSNYSEKIRQTLDKLPLVQREQYLDFLTNRSFRATLLTHAEVSIERNVTVRAVSDFHVGLADKPHVSNVDLHSTAPTLFKFSRGAVNATNPLAKAAMTWLCQMYPECVPFDELRKRAQDTLLQHCPDRNEPTPSDLKLLASTLLVGYAQNLVDLCVHPPRCIARISSHPTATPLARLQAVESDTVTNSRHEQIQLDPLAKRLMLRLDGKHDRSMLVEVARQAVGDEKAEQRPVAEGDANPAETEIPALVDKTLEAICRRGLLIG